MAVPASAVAVEAEVLVAGFLKMPRAYAFRPQGLRALARGGPALRAPVLSYIVRHPTEGPVLIDTGLHPDATRSLRDEYGPFFGLMFRSLEPASQTFADHLRAHGVELGDVRTVVMTHLHLDHTGGMRLLPNAEFVVDAREWAAATGRRAGMLGFVAEHLPAPERMRQIDLEHEGEPHGPFARSVDLLGDGSIRLLSTPGHTPGHLSVLLRLPDDREVLVVGDAAYTLESIETQRPPLVVGDGKRYKASLAALKEFRDANAGATLIPTHDPDAWRAL
jgi:N-acyl homoserine lactone hydrolase